MEKVFKRVPAEVPVSQLTPLNVTCGSTKCDDGLHCFKSSKRSMKKYGEFGVCKECGVKLIDWERVHKNNIKDAKFIFDSLRNELIRHVFWHARMPEEAIQNALTLGRKKLHTKAKKNYSIKNRTGSELSGGVSDAQNRQRDRSLCSTCDGNLLQKVLGILAQY